MLIYNTITELKGFQVLLLLLFEFITMGVIVRVFKLRLTFRMVIYSIIVATILSLLSLVIAQGGFSGSLYRERFGWPLQYYYIVRDPEFFGKLPFDYNFLIVKYVVNTLFWTYLPLMLLIHQIAKKRVHVVRLFSLGCLFMFAIIVAFLSYRNSILNKELIVNTPATQTNDQIIIDKVNKIEVVVNKVIDGDTIDASDGERLRLYEINAPEYPKDCLGVDAKTRMEDLVLSKKIQYEKLGKDNFGRILAYVFVDKLLINEVMTEEGLAYFLKGKTVTENSLLIEQSQDKAKFSERGVWSSFCQSKKDGCDIKGNYRSADNTRIYHTSDCYNYDKITIKPGTTDRWFCNETEAKSLGFIKSKDCPK